MSVQAESWTTSAHICHILLLAGMFSWLLRLCQKENGDEGDTRPTKKEEGILSHEKGRRKSFWRRHRSARNTSTQNSNITNQISNINKVRELKLDMRKISNDMEEMCGILNVYMYENLNYRMNTEFNIIKSQHEKTMLDMDKMTQSIIASMKFSEELLKDNYSYSVKSKRGSVRRPARTSVPQVPRSSRSDHEIPQISDPDGSLHSSWDLGSIVSSQPD
eukprot:XP_017171804.1 PREDICTED: uncharacterized protein Gm10410 isoform X2 [Mus musculus]